ncbi:unnamed protein product, partial [Linum tenue]
PNSKQRLTGGFILALVVNRQQQVKDSCSYRRDNGSNSLQKGERHQQPGEGRTAAAACRK